MVKTSEHVLFLESFGRRVSILYQALGMDAAEGGLPRRMLEMTCALDPTCSRCAVVSQLSSDSKADKISERQGERQSSYGLHVFHWRAGELPELALARE